MSTERTQSPALLFLALIGGLAVFMWVGKSLYQELRSRDMTKRAISGDTSAARDLLSRANQDVYAAFALGRCYLEGSCAGIAKDPEKAWEIWKRIADRVPEAAFNVGLHYERAVEGPPPNNIIMAMNYYRMAEKKLPAAAYRLGRLLEENAPYEALQLYLKAALKEDNPNVAFRIGWLYAMGNNVGTNKDYNESIKWFSKAAKLGGLPEAFFMLGYVHTLTRGLSTPSDRIYVASWYILAAQADKNKKYLDKVNPFLTAMNQEEYKKAKDIASQWWSSNSSMTSGGDYDQFYLFVKS